jgi:hypothetical protein
VEAKGHARAGQGMKDGGSYGGEEIVEGKS